MASFAENYQNHLEEGDCLRCTAASATVAAAALVVAALLIIDAFTDLFSDAGFYLAALVLALFAVVSIRALGWHRTRLHLRHRSEANDDRQ